jgi:hypothetical protein
MRGASLSLKNALTSSRWVCDRLHPVQFTLYPLGVCFWRANNKLGQLYQGICRDRRGFANFRSIITCYTPSPSERSYHHHHSLQHKSFSSNQLQLWSALYTRPVYSLQLPNMPGASLWIIPPKDSSFSQALQTLISTTIPPHFPQTKTHDFIPHVTITSNIDTSLYGSDPQAWLSALHLPSGDQHDPVFVTLDVLEAGDAFVKKLTLRAGKTAQLLQLASACRAEAVEGGDQAKAEKWAQDDYLPHLSLM